MGSESFIAIYNNAGQLYQVKVRGKLIASYYYNYRGLRTRKVTTAAAPQGAGTTFYHYDEAGHLIGESDGSGNPLHTYIWHGDTPLAQIDYVPTKRILYFDVDHLNTPRVARDQSGNVVWTWNSDGFGTTQPAASAGITVNLRFPGQYYDQESGLYYNRNRYYDPAVGRYIQSDPIGLAGGINTYTYVHGNPLVFVDPSGLDTMGDQTSLTAGAFGYGFTIGYSVQHDTSGGTTLQFTIGGGKYTGNPSISLTNDYVHTTANSVNDLTGTGYQTSVSASRGPIITGEIGKVFGTGYTGSFGGGGMGAGIGPAGTGFVIKTWNIPGTYNNPNQANIAIGNIDPIMNYSAKSNVCPR